jgi:hypothetical protein
MFGDRLVTASLTVPWGMILHVNLWAQFDVIHLLTFYCLRLNQVS